jgi:hypothetical protein
MGNLGKLADCFIKEKISYIRFFGCSVPLHDLFHFLPYQLVCREVSYHTVMGGINKELKPTQKKIYPTFPIQVGIFSLLDFGNSKVEAAALEDFKIG